MVQSPPQHSEFTAQTSPGCPQNDPLAHTSPRQSFEQHSPFAVQALPVVRQAGFKGTQAPPLQLPLQHAAELEQAWLSEMHCEPPQVPPLHTSVQHSCGLAHALPAARQVPPSSPPLPPVPPPPAVPPVLASGDPPPLPPAPPGPVDIPSTSPPPQAELPTIPITTASALFVSSFLTMCSFGWNPPGAFT